jgi:putative transposase
MAASQRGPTTTNAFKIGKKFSRAMLGKHCLDAGFGQFFNILEQTCFKRRVFFQKVDAKKTSYICPNCLNETGKKELSERVLLCHRSYTTDRDGTAAQVVLKQGLTAVGHRVKMHRTASKFMGIPAKQESPHL